MAVLAILASIGAPAPAAASPSTRAPLRTQGSDRSPGARSFDVRVLPAFAGLRVTIDGTTVRTDRAGVAHFASVPVGVDLQARVHVAKKELTVHGRRIRVEQARVLDQGAIVALYVYYRVGFTFSTLGRTPFDRAAIRTVTIKSSTGDEKTLATNKPAFLFGARVVPLSGRLVTKDVVWSVQDVPYKRANLVYSSQQRFDPARQVAVDVSLLFFHARLRIYDAFFGFGQGSSVELTFPDGTIRRYPVGPNGSVYIASLPRGTYRLTVLGAGPKMTRPVALSRDQRLDLKLYSWLDLGLVAFVGLTLVVGLLAIGWTRRRRHRRRVAARSAPQLTGGEGGDAAASPIATSNDTAASPHGAPTPAQMFDANEASTLLAISEPSRTTSDTRGDACGPTMTVVEENQT